MLSSSLHPGQQTYLQHIFFGWHICQVVAQRHIPRNVVFIIRGCIPCRLRLANELRAAVKWLCRVTMKHDLCMFCPVATDVPGQASLAGSFDIAGKYKAITGLTELVHISNYSS